METQKTLERIEVKLDKLIQETQHSQRKNISTAGATGGICGALVAALVTLIKTSMNGN